MTTLSLVAWVGNSKLGTLSYFDDTGRFAFDYETQWTRRPAAFSISPALPFERPNNLSDELHSASVRRFFENLLPEGQALEDAAMVHKISKANLFGLLYSLGRETAGALSLLPEGQAPKQQHTTKREVSTNELSQRIQDRAHLPFNIWDGKVRMSIAGLQDKLGVYIDKAQKLFLVEGQLVSTHILKPEPLNPRLSHLVVNEHLCMILASKMGLMTAATGILRVPEPVLAIERFDRCQSKEKVERLHAVDACQALDLAVSHKYERNFGNGRDVAHIRDGIGFEKLFSIAPMTQTEAATRMAFMRWAIFQYLIGNSDAHGKNISFLVKQSGLEIAPAYDLVCVCIYPEIEHDLAMAIGDEFSATKVRAIDWAGFAQHGGIERRLLAREMNRMVKVLRKQLPELILWKGYTDEERLHLNQIMEFSLHQAKQLERDAKLLPETTVE